jgi:hypothetical protein
VTVVTLNNVTPPERFDTHPWTIARIEEAPAATGPWTALPDIVLNPIDADPTSPRERDLTTTAATLDAGWYRVRFVDASAGVSAPSESVLNSRSTIRPSVKQVANLVPARTRNANGKLLQTFKNDGSTTPSADQVEELIDQAMREAYPVFGDNMPDSPGPDPDALRKSAQAVIAARAAALVERNYFAEEVNRNVSPYPQLQDDWEQGLKRVGKAMSEASVGDSIGATDDAPQAIGEFPDTPYVSGMRW